MRESDSPRIGCCRERPRSQDREPWLYPRQATELGPWRYLSERGNGRWVTGERQHLMRFRIRDDAPLLIPRR